MGLAKSVFITRDYDRIIVAIIDPQMIPDVFDNYLKNDGIYRYKMCLNYRVEDNNGKKELSGKIMRTKSINRQLKSIYPNIDYEEIAKERFIKDNGNLEQIHYIIEHHFIIKRIRDATKIKNKKRIYNLYEFDSNLIDGFRAIFEQKFISIKGPSIYEININNKKSSIKHLYYNKNTKEIKDILNHRMSILLNGEDAPISIHSLINALSGFGTTLFSLSDFNEEIFINLLQIAKAYSKTPIYINYINSINANPSTEFEFKFNDYCADKVRLLLKYNKPTL